MLGTESQWHLCEVPGIAREIKLCITLSAVQSHAQGVLYENEALSVSNWKQQLQTTAELWNCPCIWVFLPFRKAHIQSNGKHLQIPGRVVKRSTEKVSNPTAVASWSGWSSAMAWAELMDLLLLGSTCADSTGWSVGRGARETNLMLSEEGRVGGVFWVPPCPPELLTNLHCALPLVT